MYSFTGVIDNNGAASQIPEIAFHPDGALFAATFLDCNAVKLFSADTHTLLRTIGNPEAGLARPHALLVTNNHLIVSHQPHRDQPSFLNVYRLDSDTAVPVFTLRTPIENLREGHSIVRLGERFVITHCENRDAAGAMLAYRFNDDTGQITGPDSHHERVFDELGYAKGIARIADSNEIIVTFNKEKQLTLREKLQFNLFKTRNLIEQQGVRGLLDKLLHRGAGMNTPAAAHNGVATFGIDTDGRLSEAPTRVILRAAFCRLENVAIHGNLVALSDTVNNQVLLYNRSVDPDLNNPVQTLSEQLCVPHAVAFSPDGKTLLVSNFGLRMQNQVIHWKSHTRPRRDNIVVFTAAVGGG